MTRPVDALLVGTTDVDVAARGAACGGAAGVDVAPPGVVEGDVLDPGNPELLRGAVASVSTLRNPSDPDAPQPTATIEHPTIEYPTRTYVASKWCRPARIAPTLDPPSDRDEGLQQRRWSVHGRFGNRSPHRLPNVALSGFHFPLPRRGPRLDRAAPATRPTGESTPCQAAAVRRPELWVGRCAFVCRLGG